MRRAAKRHPFFLVFASVVLCISACRSDRKPEQSEGTRAEQKRAESAKPAEAPELDLKLIEQLSAIGYVSGTTPAGPLKGVTVYDEARAQKGYNFVVSGHAPVAFLMDMEGNILHEWRAEFNELWPNHPDAPGGIPSKRNFWRHAELLPNGDVIGIWNTFGIFKLDKDSTVLWAKANRAHHDLDIAEDGTIYHLTFDRKLLPEIEGQPSAVDFIVALDQNGVEQQRVSIAKSLQRANWPKLRRDFWAREDVRKHGMSPAAKYDPFHTNALWIISKEEAKRLGEPLRAGNLLVSMCLLDTIAAIDFASAETTWWQTGPFALQHQPRVTHEGNIIVFNNHLTAHTSSVQVIDPRTGKLIWEYTGPEAAPLASRTSSGVKVLENGNILIIETNKGRVLEITPKEEIVWEYHNPFKTGDGRTLVAHVYVVDRVEPSFVPWLAKIDVEDKSSD
jgi:outer membrane protein assembly factor BamB